MLTRENERLWKEVDNLLRMIEGHVARGDKINGTVPKVYSSEQIREMAARGRS
jgi:hypothetical protein